MRLAQQACAAAEILIIRSAFLRKSQPGGVLTLSSSGAGGAYAVFRQEGRAACAPPPDELDSGHQAPKRSTFTGPIFLRSDSWRLKRLNSARVGFLARPCDGCLIANQ
jgi:hypothetical protein